MSGDPAEFSIFWVVPAKDYVVETEVAGTVVFDEPLSSGDLVAGAIFDLNGNNPI